MQISCYVKGIKRVPDRDGVLRTGFPMWATGEVSGHGRFVIKAFKVPVTVGQLRIVPGDLLMADSGGVRKTKSYYFSRNAAEVTSLLRLCVAIMPYFLRMIQVPELQLPDRSIGGHSTAHGHLNPVCWTLEAGHWIPYM